MSPSWKQFREAGTVTGDERIKKLGLLIVDDEKEIVESLREVFHKYFEIHHTDSAPEALELFKQHSPKVILTDQRMPDMSGLDVLRHIREINPSTVRILITGYSDINVVIDALNEQLVWKYVAKPWEHEKLRELVLEGARHYLNTEGLEEEDYGLKGFLGF